MGLDTWRVKIPDKEIEQKLGKELMEVVSDPCIIGEVVKASIYMQLMNQGCKSPSVEQPFFFGRLQTTMIGVFVCI